MLGWARTSLSSCMVAAETTTSGPALVGSRFPDRARCDRPPHRWPSTPSAPTGGAKGETELSLGPPAPPTAFPRFRPTKVGLASVQCSPTEVEIRVEGTSLQGRDEICHGETTRRVRPLDVPGDTAFPIRTAGERDLDIWQRRRLTSLAAASLSSARVAAASEAYAFLPCGRMCPEYHQEVPVGGRGVGEGHRGRAAAVVLTVAMLTGACSSPGRGGKSEGADPTTGPPTSTAVSSSTTPTTSLRDATTAAIVAGYRAEDAAFDAVISQYPVNPADPRLPATMTGLRLSTVVSSFQVLRIQGRYAVDAATAELAPVVTDSNSTTATISDCLFDHSRIVDRRTGQTISGPDTRRTLEQVNMQLDAGTWKVSGFEQVGAGCVPGA